MATDAVQPTVLTLSAEDIGRRVRQRRQELRLTLRALGGVVGLSHVSLYVIESGRNLPSLQTALRLSVALGVDLKWLLVGDNRPGCGE